MASGLAPRSVVLRRFELRLEEAILSRLALNEEVQSPSNSKSRSSRRQPSSLVYWASHDNEVDEPAGAWLLGRGGALQRLSKPSNAVSAASEVKGFSANSSGSACLIVTDKSLVFVSEDEARIVEHRGSYGTPQEAWCRCGRHVLVATGDSASVYDSGGQKTAGLPRLKGGDSAFAWSADCNRI